MDGGLGQLRYLHGGDSMSSRSIQQMGPLLILLPVACAADTLGDADCLTTEDCAPSDVCFFLRCVDPGFSEAVVFAELSPPGDSGLLPQVVPQSRDLEAGLRQDFLLQASISVEVTLTRNAELVPAGVLEARIAQTQLPALPSLESVRQTSSTTGLFNLNVVPNRDYHLVFRPEQADVYPPLDLGLFDLSTPRSIPATYPPSNELQTVRGRIVDQSVGSPQGVGGLTVSATISSALGGAQDIASTLSTTDANGDFELVVPRVSDPQFKVQIRPGDNALGLEGSFDAFVKSTTGDIVVIDDIALELPAGTVRYEVRVLGAEGEAVSDTTVVFSRSVGQAVFRASASSDANGRVRIDLPPGHYEMRATPPLASQYGLTLRDVCLPQPPQEQCIGLPAPALSFSLATKVLVEGVVLTATNLPVPGATVTALPRGSGTVGRSVATVSGPTGAFNLRVDAGDGPSRLYDIEVAPPRESGLPLFRKRVEVYGNAMPVDVRYVESALVYGTVSRPGGVPLADVVVALYTQQTATSPDAETVLLGLGQTDTDGAFTVPVPSAVGLQP